MNESIKASPVTTAVAGLSKHCHTHLHAAIDVPMKLDAALLRRALVEVSKAVPELRGRFRRAFWRARWEFDGDPQWPIAEHEKITPPLAAIIEDDLFARPFEPYSTLPVEIEILHLPDHDRLLARVSHLLADGGGTKNLLYRIAAAYKALREDESWTATRQPAQPHPLSRLVAATRGTSLWKLLRGIVRDVVSQFGGPFVSIPMEPDARGPDRFISLRVEPDRVKRLKEAVSDSRATINDMALFAFARALESIASLEAERPRLLGAMATSDLRLLLPQPQDDVSNLSVIGPLRFAEAGSSSDQELLDAVVKETSSWKECATGLGGALLALIGASIVPHGLTRWVFTRLVGITVETMGRRAALTNMGIIDEERLDFGVGPCLAARITAPVGHPPQLVTALTGCRGGLDFSITWREGALDPDLPPRLIEHFDSALGRLEGATNKKIGEGHC